jgi:hypothetical protein
MLLSGSNDSVPVTSEERWGRTHLITIASTISGSWCARNGNQIAKGRLNGFDLSCQTPDMMMDIDEKMEGNVAKKMQVYSSDKNFAFLKKALARWNIPVGDKQLEEFRTILDSYECR